jgi:sporulation protein YlmC with PRC-barrel domain
MLHKASRIRGINIRATDGDVGRVEEFYFDDEMWTIRYFLVDTGSWLTHRRVLIPPMSIERPWTLAGLLSTLTKEQIQHSPEVDSHATMSRQDETRVLGHYGYPSYWEDGVERDGAAAERSRVKPGDEHLCGTREITGYHLQASDGEIGHVDDVLIDDESWRIRYLVVDTSNWIGGKSVVISPTALHGIDWPQSKMQVALTREAIRQSPSFDSIEIAPGEGVRIWLM